GRRPLVSVPAEGLLVECENVTFEGIDFIWQASVNAEEAAAASRAIVRLQAQTVNFRGCSFNARNAAPPAAIRTVLSHQKLSGFGVEVTLADCVFDGVRATIDHRTPEAITA